MQPLDIELNSPVDMAGELIYMDKPEFEYKNSLMYQGMASNMTYSSGDGILSTTGKHIKVDNNNRTVTIGATTIKVPTSSFTVNNRGENDIESDAVSIMGVIANKTTVRKEDGTILVNSALSGGFNWTDIRVGTVDNKKWFVWVGITASGDMGISIYDTDGNKQLYRTFPAIDNYPNLGKKLTATYIEYSDGNHNLIIGLDDDDYRKRATFVCQNDTNWGFLRGFGCVSPTGVVLGEPVPVHDYEQKWYNKILALDNVPYTELKDDDGYSTNSYNSTINPNNGQIQPSSVFNLHISGPDVFNDTRYKVLGNGVISVWTGFMNPNDLALMDSSKKIIESVCDQNAALGTYNWKRSDDDDRQGGVDKWDWKQHSVLGQFNVNNTNLDSTTYIEYQNEFTSFPGYARYSAWSDYGAYSPPSTKGLHWYMDGDKSNNYISNPIDIKWYMMYGIDFSTNYKGYRLSKGMTSMTSFLYNNSGIRSCAWEYNVLGDWSYFYDSLKSYSDTTDYDSIFPFMRMFFNNASVRGKYYDYGKGWFKCFDTNIFISRNKQNLYVFEAPKMIFTYKPNETNTQFSWGNFNTLTAGTTVDEKQVQPNYSSIVVEPIGKVRYINVYAQSEDEYNKYWTQNPTNIRIYDTNSGTDVSDISSSDFSSWFIYSYSKQNDKRSSSSYMFRMLDMQAGGAGIKEPGYNFFGFNDASILDKIDYSMDVSPDKSGNIRLGTYSNLSIALSCNGTLIFNGTDLDDKWWIMKDDDTYHLTIYVDGKEQHCDITKNGTISVDKLTDYMFRINVCGGNNLIRESREGVLNVEDGFKAFIGETVLRVAPWNISLPTDSDTTNANIYVGEGINVNMNSTDSQPSFLLPAKSFEHCYILNTELTDVEDKLISNFEPFLSDKLRQGDWTDEIQVFDTISNYSTDITYRYTVKLPDSEITTTENYTGVQSVESDMADNTYYIDSETTIYPVAIASTIKGINYATSTISLPGNYAVRFYRNNNDTWCVYNSLAQVYYGSNIFTIMGSNYYFDGQGIYYLGSESSGVTTQYSSNVLIAYAIGMEYLCNAPSEAYFYSPFDRCLYLFTSSNTMQKSTCLAGYGDILDSCYCPVNQSLYILFDGKLFIKTQDDSCILDVEGTKLMTTTEGVQVTTDTEYKIHSIHAFSDIEDLHIETDWLGNPDALSKYSYADILFYQDSEENVDIKCDLQTMANETVTSDEKTITIKPTDFKNGVYRLRLNPKEPVGNAFKIIIKSSDNVGVISITMYMENVSLKNSAGGHR